MTIGDKRWELTLRLSVAGGYTNSLTLTGDPSNWRSMLAGAIAQLTQWADKLHEQDQDR